jgi:dolichol-phosphate mannosyltransferase
MLAVVMPVYNEAAVIEDVVEAWLSELERLGIRSELHVYNDGSTDGTLKRLRGLPARPGLVIHDKPNSGHGATVLQAYREQDTPEWIFQVDSDGEIGPEFFEALWRNREGCDLLIGRRVGRAAPLPRRIMTLVARVLVRACYGRGLTDVNSPYRLMRNAAFRPLFAAVPGEVFAPNVLLAGLAARHHLRIMEIPVRSQPRPAGRTTLRGLRLLPIALRSFREIVRLRRG